MKTLKEIYTTKRKRKLSGWKLETFNKFWDAFAYKTGKAEAADAWLDIPGLSAELVGNEILPAALREAQHRTQLRENNHTPKMAQGWLSGRRWKVELLNSKKSNGMPDRSEDEWQLVAKQLRLQEWMPPAPWLPWRDMVYAKEKQAVGEK